MPERGVRSFLQERVSATGLVLAGTFFALSLTPSLMPRDPVVQGVLGGVVAAVGYEVANLVRSVWRWLGLPDLLRPRPRPALRVGLALALACAAVGLWLAPGWQDATRRVVGLPPVEDFHRALIAGVALPLFLLVWGAGRIVGVLGRRLSRWGRRYLPPRIAAVGAIVLVAALVSVLVNGVLLRAALGAADASFAAADVFLDPEQPAPVDPERTGGAASLLRWEDLGRWGRDFVHRTPTAAQLASLTGRPATEPIRVYVGRRSAETAEERARLAVAELVRVGGFDKGTLVVAIPPGTGWMDPGAHDTVEAMLDGDVATLGVQYSYLTSVLSLWVAPEYGLEQGAALFDAVYEEWRSRPPEERPRLYVFGLSQGALNSQAGFPLLDMLADPIDGALWAGSPFLSPLWQRVRDGRDPESPVWRPRYGNGSLIRVMSQEGFDPEPADPWGPLRIVLLNYPSDAIVHFTPVSALRRPAFLAGPRAPDVSPELRWFPVVTMFQMALDMVVALQVPGHGHYYVAEDYIDAWAALVDPPDWTPARRDALAAAFRDREAF
ncbi:alpha/beta hydrolase [Rubellimicrobium roseum]|uniref:Alpha/beta-hydrolase family protein n=1 Tax=Rubellimicrobium roseum TaxID=687525 RepID=A0A5C4N895_9RHOB|nr:alpha/beta-hydrolase family protein [Rubellimicrobium roseum]TNC65382.1 hypothetical protein FHG71_17670 [Rubellimicrobium roseum]